MARIAWFFDVPDESTLPDRIQSLFAKARERLGFLPNVFANYSVRPERFSAWFAHYQQLHEPTEHLDEADREMIAVVVSAYNRCTYCIVSHGHALRVALGGDLAAEVLADHIATNWRHADLDERQRAICAYAEKLTATPHQMSRGRSRVAGRGRADQGRGVGRRRDRLDVQLHQPHGAGDRPAAQ